jgi:hypothetical protein
MESTIKNKDMSKETKETMTHKEFLSILSKMGREGKLDIDTRYELMDMAGKLSISSYNRGMDKGQEIASLFK